MLQAKCPLRLHARFSGLAIMAMLLVLSKTVCGNKTTNYYTIDSTKESQSEPLTCPPWTTPTGNNTSCQCGYTGNEVVLCTNNNMTVSLPLCYCMSYNELFNTTVVGYCITKCFNYNYGPSHVEETHYRYKVLARPKNVSEMNLDLCGDLHMHRTGQLCGTCEEGYAPPVYSYSLACVKCTDYKYNWIKYIAITYLPLTVFYVLVTFFRISATSGAMNGFIFTCQMIASPLVVKMVETTILHNNAVKKSTSIPMKITEGIYGIWNLDFFRSLYTPFCLHPNTSQLLVLSLDYAVAVYPLLLIVVTYNLKRPHERCETQIVVKMWKPFNICFKHFREEWKIEKSLINAFVTFFLLSYTKIMRISLDLLTPVTLFDMNGDTVSKRYLRVDGTIEYFGTHHLLYALLALVMVTVFNILPVILLCLYPCRCFQKCLNYCNFQRLTLNTFMDIVYGPFKTCPDRRCFAAFYLAVRMINLTLYALTNGFVYFTVVGVALVIATFILAVGQPYRNHIYNVLDLMWFLLLILFAFEYPSHIFHRIFSPDYYSTITKVWIGVYLIVFAIPQFYGVPLLIYTFTPQQKLEALRSKITDFYKRITKPSEEQEPLVLPDRLEHPERYPVLPV